MATAPEGTAGTPSAVPIPDPTILTTEQLLREITTSREVTVGQLDVIRQRLDGMDVATQLLNDQMTHVPTEVDKQVGHLKEVMAVELKAVDQRFVERDTRSERESRDNKVAVDAAFAAQKEAASEQNKSNTLAIDKSEKATAETLNKQADLFKSTIDAQAAQIADLKERIVSIEAGKHAVVETTTTQRSVLADSRAFVLGSIGAVFGVLGVLAAVVIAVVNHH